MLFMYGKTIIFLSIKSLFSFISSEFDVDGFLLLLINDFNLSLILSKIKSRG